METTHVRDLSAISSGEPQIPREANIVEGYALASTGQFRRHVCIARGSAAECEHLIRLAREQGYLAQSAIKDIGTYLDAIGKTVGGLLRKLSANP